MCFSLNDFTITLPLTYITQPPYQAYEWGLVLPSTASPPCPPLQPTTLAPAPPSPRLHRAPRTTQELLLPQGHIEGFKHYLAYRTGSKLRTPCKCNEPESRRPRVHQHSYTVHIEHTSALLPLFCSSLSVPAHTTLSLSPAAPI